MKVLIISGFLGAGKTTFIKELIRQTGKQFVVLENEYGEANLDAKELKDNSGMKIYEFSDGCVCCTQQSGFASSIITISSTLNPEFLIVEPTGIGKLGNIIKTVKDYEYEHISLLNPVTILSPENFEIYKNQYSDIYIDQIVNTKRVVFSKCENIDGDYLLDIAEKIKDISRGIEVNPCHYSNNPKEWWEGLLRLDHSKDAVIKENNHDIFSDNIQEYTLKGASVLNPSSLIIFLERLLHGFYGNIIRAKGLVRAGGMLLRFDVADGCYGIIEEKSQSKPQSVFIGYDIDVNEIKQLLSPSKKHRQIYVGKNSK